MQTYIADVDSVGLGQFKGGSVMWHVNADLFCIPDFPIFSLSERKNKHVNFFILTP